MNITHKAHQIMNNNNAKTTDTRRQEIATASLIQARAAARKK